MKLTILSSQRHPWTLAGRPAGAIVITTLLDGAGAIHDRVEYEDRAGVAVAESWPSARVRAAGLVAIARELRREYDSPLPDWQAALDRALNPRRLT